VLSTILAITISFVCKYEGKLCRYWRGRVLVLFVPMFPTVQFGTTIKRSNGA
jgi:hypothetical protein